LAGVTSRPLSLAVPSWVDGFGQYRGRNGEFCVRVGPFLPTVSIQKHDSFIESSSCRLNDRTGDELPRGLRINLRLLPELDDTQNAQL